MNDVNLLFNSSSEIFHHGIEGQKWGVRNGPPYPLDRDNAGRIVREKREKIQKARDNLYKNTGKGRAIKTGAIAAGALKAAPFTARALGMIDDPDEYGGKASTIIGITAGAAVSAAMTYVDGRIVGAIYGAVKGNTPDYDKALKELKDAKQEYKLSKEYVKLATNERLTPSQEQRLLDIKKQIDLQ